MTGERPLSQICRRVSLVMLILALLCDGCSGPPKRVKSQVPTVPVAVKKRPRSQPSAPVIDEIQPPDFPSIPFTGMVWEWLGNLTPTDTLKAEPNGRYTLEFYSDGWFKLQADCRQGEGIYEISGQRIALAVVKLSEADCPPGSHHDLYVNSLESAGSFGKTGDKLYLHMRREAKTMVFWTRK